MRGGMGRGRSRGVRREPGAGTGTGTGGAPGPDGGISEDYPEVMRLVGQLNTGEPYQRVAAADEVVDLAELWSGWGVDILAMNLALVAFDEKNPECLASQLRALVELVETGRPDTEVMWPIRQLAPSTLDVWSRRYLDHLLATLAAPAAVPRELIMDYWRVRWHHDVPEDPALIFCEIGPDGYETRKVEEFHDGRLAWADEQGGVGTFLGEIRVGSIAEVQAQEEFTASVITPADFRVMWGRALRRPNH